MEQTVGSALEDRVALAVAHERGAARSDWKWSRTPNLAGLFVAQVDGFAGRIGDGVIAPGCKAVRLAVAAPRITGSALGNQKPEKGIGDDVDPWRGASCGWATAARAT